MKKSLTIVISFIFVYTIALHAAETGRSDDPSNIDLKTLYRQSQIVAERAIKDRLVSPASAKFTFTRVEQVPGRLAHRPLVELVGYVDSQNRFGAMLRSEFLVRVERQRTDGATFSENYRVIGLEIQ